MYLGKLMEVSPAEELYENPLHPYTISLLSAIPIADPDVAAERKTILLAGDLPSAANPPPACRFHTRCPYVQPTRCRDEEPPLRPLAPGHTVACHWAEDIKSGKIRPTVVAPTTLPRNRSPMPDSPREEVVPVRAEPHADAEQVTQVLRGEPLDVEERVDGWARIRTAYDYPGGCPTRGSAARRTPTG